MGKLFGTDGIRGIVGEDLTCKLATKVGEAAAHVLGKNENIKVLIGSDTRISGTMLTMAISAGLMSGGAKVIDLGIVPTPAVSYLIKEYDATIGIMISASHNPSEYNGIKIFDNNGYKLPDEKEEEIEKYLLGELEIPKNKNIGTYEICKTALKDYTNYLATTVNNINKNLKIVIDCAYGSASTTAPLLFDALNLTPEFINKNYDGYNINKNAGSTHLEGLIEKVKETNADIGIAYDGDADRCLMVDELGNVVDGDQIMAMCALNLKQENKLTNNTLVATIMSNLGLVKMCKQNGINFVATKVGDRYVLENMLKNNYVIGGEQSGHIIFKELSNTGDGELTSIQVLNLLTKENKKLSEQASIMTKYPQVLVNVNVKDEYKKHYERDEEISNLIKETENNLNDDGRIVIRPSGTESLIRIMIEGINQEEITKDANKIAKLIKKKYGN